jgi:hypothetical protein
MKFRKIPVVVEAVQWFKPGDHPLDQVWPYALALPNVRPGYWIVMDKDGGVKIYSPELFAKTYEPAEDQARGIGVDITDAMMEAGCAVVDKFPIDHIKQYPTDFAIEIFRAMRSAASRQPTHSKSEYKRLKALGKDVIPPGEG